MLGQRRVFKRKQLQGCPRSVKVSCVGTSHVFWGWEGLAGANVAPLGFGLSTGVGHLLGYPWWTPPFGA